MQLAQRNHGASAAEATAAAITASRTLERTSVIAAFEERPGDRWVTAAGDPKRERGDAGKPGEGDRHIERTTHEGDRGGRNRSGAADVEGEAAEEDDPDRVAEPLHDDCRERPRTVRDEVSVEHASRVTGVWKTWTEELHEGEQDVADARSSGEAVPAHAKAPFGWWFGDAPTVGASTRG